MITSAVGVVALGAALEGHFLRDTTWYERVLLAAAASSPTLLSGILRDRRALLRFLLLCLFFALLLNVGLGEATFADLPLHGFPAWVRY